MVFPSKVTEQDEGLYACQASFYHHTATVDIRVEVMSKKRLFGELQSPVYYCVYLLIIRLSSSIYAFDNFAICVFSAMAAIVGISFAFAIMLVLVITVWVCW